MNHSDPKSDSAKAASSQLKSPGMASSPDAQKRFSASNQERWLEFSKEVMLEFRSRLGEFKEFNAAFKFLADKRKAIAKELHHGAHDKRTEKYGSFREPGAGTMEEFWEHDQNQPWLGQKDTVYNLVDNLISESREYEIKLNAKTQKLEQALNEDNEELADILQKELKDFPISTYNCEKNTYDRSSHRKDPVIEYKIKIMHHLDPINDVPPKKEYQLFLAEITKQEFPEDKKKNKIIIKYAIPSTQFVAGNNILADRYYKAMLSWKSGDDVRNFLINSGRLAHLEVHLLPLSLGTAGCIEWMIRGLAAAKGIELGPFNFSENISWDFKALCTPLREEYAKWYAEKAFQATPHVIQQPLPAHPVAVAGQAASPHVLFAEKKEGESHALNTVEHSGAKNMSPPKPGSSNSNDANT